MLRYHGRNWGVECGLYWAGKPTFGVATEGIGEAYQAAHVYVLGLCLWAHWGEVYGKG